MSDSLWPRGHQHTRLLYPSLSLRVYSNSCTLSQWCYLTITSSATPFSFGLQSFSASGSFPMSPLFISSGQSIGASASAWVLPMNIQGWFPLGLTGFVSLQFKGLSRVFSSIPIRKSETIKMLPSICTSLPATSHHFKWLYKYHPIFTDRGTEAQKD